MNIHKENDIIKIQDKLYKLNMTGDLCLIHDDACMLDDNEYKAHDNFYIHSGYNETITYNTVAPDGRVIVVNTFNAEHHNQGILRDNGRG